MNIYFNVNLEFDHEKLHQKIEEVITLKQKGYVCVVDGNVLTMAQKNLSYREIINSSTINTCDGSSIAMLAGMIYKKKFRALNGPDIFSNYIEKDYNQLLLGSTEEISNEIKRTLSSKAIDSSHLYVMPLPFLPVDEFDYPSISKQINQLKPDIIWVSLGAPKQEMFMSKLLPYIDSGLMFGIGAAFNLYLVGKSNKRASFFVRKLNLEWLYRVLKEPNRIGRRAFNYLILIPRLISEERKRLKYIKQNNL